MAHLPAGAGRVGLDGAHREGRSDQHRDYTLLCMHGVPPGFVLRSPRGRSIEVNAVQPPAAGIVSPAAPGQSLGWMRPTALAARLPLPEARVLSALPGNLTVAALYVVLAVSHHDVARRTGQWATTTPLVLQEAVLVGLFLVRRPTLAISRRALDWGVAIAGSLLPLAMRPTDP